MSAAGHIASRVDAVQFREYVDLVRRAYAGEKLDASGTYFSSRGFKIAFGCPHPLRLYLAALGPRMTRLAGVIADGLIINIRTRGSVPRGNRRRSA